MNEQPKNGEEREGSRKPYAKPELVEYGPLEKLTQSGGTRTHDVKRTKLP